MSAKRSTLQRQIILTAIKSLDSHPSAEEMYAEIQKHHPVIGKSTVYRNLRQLAEEGVISHVVIDGVSRYDRNITDHQHFICDVCNRVYDVEIDCNCSSTNGLDCRYGFKTVRHELAFFGTCSKCGTHCSL